jgi:hypothetical protein
MPSSSDEEGNEKPKKVEKPKPVEKPVVEKPKKVVKKESSDEEEIPA